MNLAKFRGVVRQHGVFFCLVFRYFGESGSRFDADLAWIFAFYTHKKAPCFRMRLVCLIDAWQFPTLAW
ncbi:hypothetical protein, partial [Pantoea agglomerans]